MVTLKELADRTGYSSATISRILTGDPSLSVPPETRRKVLEEAGRMNYSATRSSRGRTPKNALRVGLAEMLTPAQQLADPYYLYLSGFVRQGCQERRFACLPLKHQGEADFALEKEILLDGIAAIGLFTPPQIEALARLSPNVVFLDSSPWESRFDSVVLGYELGISLALEHLMSLGHRRIGFVGPAFKLDDRRQRAPEVRRGLFLRLMAQRGLEPVLLLDCPMETEAAAQAAAAFLNSGAPLPTALLCANEESAVGVLWALRQAGVLVPEQLSLVSFNDTPRSALVNPPLTSVATHAEEMAAAALRLLAERAVPPGRQPLRTLPLKVVVPPTLTVRSSSGPPRAL